MTVSMTDRPAEDQTTEYDKYGFISNLAPPYMAAKQWVILDGNLNEIFCSKNEHIRTEITCMSKLMTCFLAI